MSGNRVIVRLSDESRSMGRAASTAKDVLQDIGDGSNADEVIVVVDNEEAVHLVGVHLSDHLAHGFSVRARYRTKRLL